MTTLQFQTRLPHRCAQLGALAAAMLALAGAQPPQLPEAPAPLPGPSIPRMQVMTALPFGMGDVVAYFREALEKEPVRTGSTTIFDSGTTLWPEDHYRIVINAEGNDIVIIFALGGGTGMAMAREFFEAPFFNRAESEQLHRMVDRAHHGPTEKLRRFTITMRSWETQGDWLFMLRFTPPHAPSKV